VAGWMKIVQALAVAVAVQSVASTQVAAADGAKPLSRLPDRLLDCTLGRAINLDPKRLQNNGEVHYEGAHHFQLFLPGIPARTTPPPDATEPPEPVDPRTRIVSDPDKLSTATGTGFDRVVDYWPDRVELVATIDDPLVSLIIVHPIDPARGTANLFLTRAKDLATFDLDHVYQGNCTVHLDQDARKLSKTNVLG